MVQLHLQEIEQYRHSPVHYAVARQDYTSLKSIFSTLPSLPKAGEVVTEEESILAEAAADKVSSIVDRRDVPGRETPLHLAVRLGDAASVEMLMAAGADWSLQNEQGWSALQEAVCTREEGIAMIITRYYQPLAWAKWCRRLPRITGTMRRMRDFYMEITFNFESSVIPFISRIAPSDTYRIWKRGSNLRADMTLAGFDGFKIQRADQSFLFLGDGTEDSKVPPGSLLVLTHKEKEVTNALEGAGAQPSEADIAQEVAVMSQTNMYRPGIDVTQAELVPQLTWRRQEKAEMVGPWKAKVFDMHYVQISVRSRRVPGAMTDEELFAVESEAHVEREDDYAGLLTEEEKQQLETVLNMEGGDMYEDDNGGDIGSGLAGHVNSNNYGEVFHARGNGDLGKEDIATISSIDNDNGSKDPEAHGKGHKKSWFVWGKKAGKPESEKRKDLSYIKTNGNNESEGLNTTLTGGQTPESNGKKGDETVIDEPSARKAKEGTSKRVYGSKEKHMSSTNGNHESEYKKGLRPILWLTPDFPLKMEDLLPLLDILANKVKAVRRLRELLTTKLPTGTFPVKVAIPIIPTIRVVVTFNKFEELGTEEFSTPLSSPTHFSDSKCKEHESPHSSSWLPSLSLPRIPWIRVAGDPASSTSDVREDFVEDMDPFVIPSDYTWLDMKEKKRRLKDKKTKIKKSKRPSVKPPEAAAEIEGKE